MRLENSNKLSPPKFEKMKINVSKQFQHLNAVKGCSFARDSIMQIW